jgi:predicted protein tyrosine phosphatase
MIQLVKRGKKILFVCTQNRVRSFMAEQLFQGRNGCQTKSAGIAKAARVKLTEELVRWADLVVFMEQNHQDHVAEAFPKALAGKPTACLQISDLYYYGDPDLKADLEKQMQRVL